MKKLLIAFAFVALSPFGLMAQDFEVSVTGIKEGDSIRLVVQKNSEYFFKEWVHYNADGPSTAIFNGLVEGLWALSIDATGYTFPSTSVFNYPETTTASVELTPMLNDNYTYNWRDDGSAAGHATQSYQAEPTEIVVLNDTVSVPTGFSAIKLRTEYGVLLSDDIEPWSNEDAYRLYKMFSNLPYNPYGEGSTVDFSNGENVRGVFYLSNDEIYEDISIETIDGIKHATVSQSAFTYADPQIVKIDGIRGKFFSKRLYHTVVNFITDFARDDEMVSWLARERFGIEFLKPGSFLEELMAEDSSNFQEFYATEKLEILAMFEELPEGFHKQEGLKYLVRRIDGQDHPLPAYRQAAAIAWTGLKTIEFISKAFIGGNLSDVRRLILHEKAHFLWEYTFDDSTKSEWIEIGGWFEDPTSGTGWSTYNTSEFVSAYAHAKNPNEDMAESIAIYLTNPDRLINVSMKKYEFIRDRIMHGTRYVAQIREDLTFTVYNLFPDYIFPGKIIEVDLFVEGAANEDKTVTMEVVLDSEDPEIDGAVEVYTRFSSSIGTIFDIRLHPKNGSIDSVLVGSASLSKFAKSGYWNMGSAAVYDQVRNARYENTSTLGVKLFIENPLEDITPPKFIDFSAERVEGKFSHNGNFIAELDENGENGQAIKMNARWEEKNQLRGDGAVVRIDFPNPDQSETYYMEGSVNAKDPLSIIKELEGYFVIPDYFPTGYYGFVSSYTGDEAGNSSGLTFVNDLDDFYYNDDVSEFATLRDSIYFETEFPDIIKPEIDLNNISVQAEPTNPEAPNGETRVDINFNARDLSDFPGHEAGVYIVNLILQNPEGKQFGYQTGNVTMNHPDLDLADLEPENNSEWKNYRFDLVLPAGSAPGLWGISDITIIDKVGNTRAYNFVEYVRFDIIKSDVVLDEPLQVEIMDKVINAGNVDSIRVKMSCIPCQGLGYVATIYSRFGGGAVVRSEGILDSNEVIIEDLNTTDILDGEVNLTVQLIDSESNLITQKSVAYTKDVVYPSAYYTRSNLQDEGHSNLDDLVIDVEYSSEDEGGTYTYETGIAVKSSSTNDLVPSEIIEIKEGTLYGDIVISDSEIVNVNNGFVYEKLSVSDPNGNAGKQDPINYFVVTQNESGVKRIKKYRENDTDFDDDGVINEQDALQYDALESLDTDSDGIGNVTDTDDDGDEVPDTEDAFPLDPTESVDTDSDGIGNNADTDDDGDDWSDADETAEGTDPLDAQSVPVDTDGDGIGNVTDTDDDNDEVPDTEDAFPLDATESIDTDSDGIGNNADTDDDGDDWSDADETAEGTDPLDAQSVPVDTDGDGIGNVTDTDDDNDEVPDTEDAFPLDATESIDTDSDGIGNNADTDDDNDEVPDAEDAFPLDPTEAYDADGDGIGDNADDDDDNDLVKDVYDQCPNTEPGTSVNAAGCEVFALPSNTFTVSVTSATCPDSSNGSITISSSNTEYSYRYAIDDQAPQALTDNTQTISNLSAGIYTVCVTVDGVADYQRCYTIEITEPAPLVASSRIDMSSRNMQLDLSGSEEYQVTINGKTFLTSKDRLSLNLEPGMNRVEVATALDCQGVYFEEIFVSEKVKVYPNPTKGPLQLFVAGSDKEVELSITSLSGGVLRRETLSVPSNRIVETSLGNLPEGLYLITLNGTTVKTTHKVIKE
jgi:hypothetical protein